MTAELGMNLAGVERVFELEQQLGSMHARWPTLEKRAGELNAEVKRLEALRRELRAEIVPYERGGEIVRQADVQRSLSGASPWTLAPDSAALEPGRGRLCNDPGVGRD